MPSRLHHLQFKRPDLLKGFEPDSSFYFRYAAAMNGKSEVDLTVDPPPELVIEVDNTRNSLDRFPLFAAIGVAEVWRYKDVVVTMFALRDNAYTPIENSLALPILSAVAVTRFVEEGLTTQRVVWFENVKEWVRQSRESGKK